MSTENKGFAELAAELGIRSNLESNFSRILKLPYAEQPEAMFDLLFDMLPTKKQIHLASQFGYETDAYDCSHYDADRYYNDPDEYTHWVTTPSGRDIDFFNADEALAFIKQDLCETYCGSVLMRFLRNPRLFMTEVFEEVA